MAVDQARGIRKEAIGGCPNNENIRCGGGDFVGDIVIAGVDGEDFADLPTDWDGMNLLFPELWTSPKKEGNQWPY